VEASARDERAEAANLRNESSTKATIEAIEAMTTAQGAEAAARTEELKFLKDSIEEKRDLSLIKTAEKSSTAFISKKRGANQIKVEELCRHISDNAKFDQSAGLAKYARDNPFDPSMNTGAQFLRFEMSCQMTAISVYRKCFSVWHAWFGTKFQDKIEEKVLEYITNHSNYESDGNHTGAKKIVARDSTWRGALYPWVRQCQRR